MTILSPLFCASDLLHPRQDGRLLGLGRRYTLSRSQTPLKSQSPSAGRLEEEQVSFRNLKPHPHMLTPPSLGNGYIGTQETGTACQGFLRVALIEAHSLLR